LASINKLVAEYINELKLEEIGDTGRELREAGVRNRGKTIA
jgi:hypothetical protein